MNDFSRHFRHVSKHDDEWFFSQIRNSKAQWTHHLSKFSFFLQWFSFLKIPSFSFPTNSLARYLDGYPVIFDLFNLLYSLSSSVDVEYASSLDSIFRGQWSNIVHIVKRNSPVWTNAAWRQSLKLSILRKVTGNVSVLFKKITRGKRRVQQKTIKSKLWLNFRKYGYANKVKSYIWNIYYHVYLGPIRIIIHGSFWYRYQYTFCRLSAAPRFCWAFAHSFMPKYNQLMSMQCSRTQKLDAAEVSATVFLKIIKPSYFFSRLTVVRALHSIHPFQPS